MTAANGIKLAEEIKGEVRYSVPLSEHTSFRVGGPVDFLIFPADLEDLRKTLQWCRRQKIFYFILGNGSNLLVRDGGIRGVAISLARGFQGVAELERGEREGLLQAGAAEPLGRLVELCREKGLTGMEWAVGIPGTVGGALFMNAGAFRSEMKDTLESLQLMDGDGKVIETRREELHFSYRSLELKKGWVILGGKFRLKIGSSQAIRSKMEDFLKRRTAKQPLHLPSAGSVFKNPSRVSAGQLIEEVGLKGTRLREAQISEKHANFIVNLGKAKARDILTLAEWAKEKVYQEKGVKLEMEIQVMGEDE
ncbi:MAG: UDP-N-acetylmuramate dehydrogenase [Syntrophaceae bacterium]|nr:UDP-N-acetylmuramate dehydrogenase [Syntrophaceae bacterium]